MGNKSCTMPRNVLALEIDLSYTHLAAQENTVLMAKGEQMQSLCCAPEGDAGMESGPKEDLGVTCLCETRKQELTRDKVLFTSIPRRRLRPNKWYMKMSPLSVFLKPFISYELPPHALTQF